MIEELQVGKEVEFVKFGFSSDNRNFHKCIAHGVIEAKQGGYYKPEIILKKPVKGIVIKRWDDYECGERSWVKPDKELQKLLNDFGYKTDILYVGEFDLLTNQEE